VTDEGLDSVDFAQCKAGENNIVDFSEKYEKLITNTFNILKLQKNIGN